MVDNTIRTSTLWSVFPRKVNLLLLQCITVHLVVVWLVYQHIHLTLQTRYILFNQFCCCFKYVTWSHLHLTHRLTNNIFVHVDNISYIEEMFKQIML